MVNRSGFFRAALLFLLFFLATGSWSQVLAQDDATTHIELILDASGSMWAKLGGSTRIEVAKDALGKIIDDLSERKGIAVGLRVYGHRTNDCKDTKLEIPIGPMDEKKMKAFIGKIKPKGKTPIAYSLQEAAKDFKKDFTGSKVIILVTDGLESCGGDPCAAAKVLAEKGIVSKIHVVGFGMDKKSVSKLECIVKPSGGLLLEANSAAELAKAFDTIVKTALDTNLEVTGLDGKGKPVEMSVSVLQEGDEVLSEKGQTVKANLPEGSYLVRATATETGEEIFFEGVDLVEDKLTSLKAVFSIARIRVRALDSAGKPVRAEWQIFRKDAPEEPVVRFSGADWTEKALSPGEYTLKAHHRDTKVTLTADAAPGNGETAAVELVFAQGKLLISGLDSNGKPVYTDSYVYKAPFDRDNPDEAARDGGNKHEYSLVPGTYDILVRDHNTKVEQWIRDVVIEGGKTVRKEVSFSQGTVRLTVKGFEGKPVYFFTEIFLSPAEENDEFVHSDSGENEVSFPIVPGTYDVKVWTEEPRAELWEKGMEVKAGATAAKSFAFPAARVRITPPKKGTEWTYIFVDVFPHPAGEDDEAAVSEAGAEEHIQFFLVPGTYDFRIRDEEERETWMRGIELAADEKFAGEVKFED
ncbi:MAG: VWA domain-containing protein [Aminivibrio sp.]|uniref:vWA domain-containing protein n=1 Tax=Aminivibrio sp. TaxID=1872489 RepID=UPI002B2140F4|nr:VWA domain-containing protein [Aminivibrio sp.]MEA4952665.1 VWA domain-containing protein [Aminivibrio sp.]